MGQTNTQEAPTQEAPHPFPKPQKEHQWLDKFVGEWKVEGEAIMGPDKPAEKFSSTESVRSIGGLWIVGEGKMPGMSEPATTIITLGFDPQKNRFVGTFIGSMMTNMWVYSGELDATGRILTLDTEGPSFKGDGSLAKYQDIIEIMSDDHRVLTSQFQMEDGSWNRFMTAHYRRA
jgi:hypothetical protein